MKAAIFKQAGQPLEIEEITLSNPGHNEVLVEVAATGLCHTDLHFMDGHLPVPAPAVLGHETAGIVRAVGAGVSYLQPGDHVIGCLSAFCGSCHQCLSGHPSICEDQASINRDDKEEPRLMQAGSFVQQFMNLSAFADHMLVHEHALAKIDKAMPLDKAALIGCGVTTGIGAVMRTAKVELGSSVVVIGCGAVGLNAVQGARMAGALNIIAIDINADRLAMAKKFGATHVINSKTASPVDQVMQITLGKGAEYAFEAVGSPQLARDAFMMLRKNGTLVLIGLMSQDAEVSLPFMQFIAERRVMGCDMGSNQFRTDMQRLVAFYLDGRLNLDDMLTGRIPLNKINDGFDDMRKGHGIRTIIDFSVG
ncbi:Zn-dependent alcohol dehydrogenase [uncultured Maritalea sp.]|jgi:S-(hydroxymethyl)glutathione dehydrogenase/alcohol dehydrogenase|uniref:Zn-dependent alcohol dehydrogenase n=1 Tax=uncultured Maritalea sp. TaxID=757249 RepID=UPI0026082713|nr:Zn-dependent alcohol dehydrogenase [uncultured Maritalea sp.]